MDMANLGEHMIQRIAEEVSSRTEAKTKTESQPTTVSTDQQTVAGEKKVTLTVRVSAEASGKIGELPHNEKIGMP